MVKNVTEGGATFETGWRVETTELAEVKGNLSGCHHSCKFTWLGTRSESASCTVHIILKGACLAALSLECICIFKANMK